MDFEAFIAERRRLYDAMERELRKSLEDDGSDEELDPIEQRYRATIDALDYDMPSTRGVGEEGGR